MSFKKDELIQAQKEVIERLEDRLEVYDSTGKVRLPEDCDGIACRDETIKMLDEQRKSQSAENKILRAIYDTVIDGGVVYDFFDVVEAADDYFASVSAEQTPVCPETAIEKDCTQNGYKDTNCRHLGDTRTEGGMTYCDDCGEPL